MSRAGFIFSNNRKKSQSVDQQVFVYQLTGMILAIFLSFGLSLYLSVHNEMSSLDRNISSVGTLLSNSPEVQNILKRHDLSPEYHAYLNHIIQNLDYVDLVSICDTDSIRLYHTDPQKIGEHFYGADEGPALKGADPYFTYGTGSLGKQRRVFYPIRDQEGNLLGFIMVSVLISHVYSIIFNLLTHFFLIFIIFLFLGCFFANSLRKRLHSVLLGHKPEEFTKLYIAREEVLDSLEEGIFAVNNSGSLILINESACKMLNLPGKPSVGTYLPDIFPETRLMHTLETGTAEYNIDFSIRNRNILSSRIPIMDKNQLVGAVAIFRDKTDFTKLAEELTGARYMVDTLRAFNHEFKNKLHVILGYVEMGEYQKVTELILNSNLESTKAVEQVTRQIHIPSLAALVIGKILRANELGIQLKIKPDSFCHESHTNLPNDLYITILGNLVDNSIEALNQISNHIKEIHIGIYIWTSGMILSVDDTADGIPPEIRDKVFTKGFSTKGTDRGVGLALIKEIVDLHHGTIEVETSPGVGTSFTITISDSTKEG